MNRISTVLLLMLTAAGLGAQDWYRSTASGVPGDRLSDGPSASGWSLAVERSGEQESRSLYKDGTLRGTTVFIRRNGRLIAREERDAEGVPVSRVEYAYDSEGNPRAVFIGTDINGLNSERITTRQTVSADGKGLRTADGSGEEWRIRELDSSRNPVRQVSLDEGALVEQTSWERRDDGTLIEEVRETGNDVIRSRYDRDGRLVEEILTRNSAVVRTRFYQWNEGNLVEIVEQGEGRVEVRQMTWIGDRRTDEVRQIDGVTVSETSWSSDDERIETLFRDGAPVIRVYWKGGTRVREEFLKDGEVIRVQENVR